MVKFMETATELSLTAYQPLASTASESVLALDEDSIDQTNFYVTADQDSTTTEVPQSDRDEEQILIFN